MAGNICLLLFLLLSYCIFLCLYFYSLIPYFVDFNQSSSQKNVFFTSVTQSGNVNIIIIIFSPIFIKIRVQWTYNDIHNNHS